CRVDFVGDCERRLRGGVAAWGRGRRGLTVAGRRKGGCEGSRGGGVWEKVRGTTAGVGRRWWCRWGHVGRAVQAG
ncbi:hypothetical protein KI387_021512, partial [Taxus chinensis]